MPIQLNREFSIDFDDAEVGSWSRFLPTDKSDLTWAALKNRNVVVVLGEAGVGKTSEFLNRVDLLRTQGTFAFFVPLSGIIDSERWALTPDDTRRLKKWMASGKAGYFFLDAIDESRLRDTNAFTQALAAVHDKLQDFFKHAHFILSSRHSDWAVMDVQDAVHAYLTRPTTLARLPPADTQAPEDDESTGVDVEDAVARVEPVLLKPLSKDDRERLAQYFGLQDSVAFWRAVTEGDYVEMAVRPRDLQWLVEYWNSHRSLGDYLALMKTHVEGRLTEHNIKYSRVALASDKMREGAEELAAAAEVSGMPFISLGSAPRDNELSAREVLAHWDPSDSEHLLNSAVFDLSTFDRVKFNHRSIREFLFGSWTVRKLRNGVPFDRLLKLFVTQAYGKDIVIPSRRYGLSWACALHPEFRQWTAQRFPEIYVFDGDPVQWDAATAEIAFAGYIKSIAEGLRRDWWNSVSELRRAVVPLRPKFLPRLLKQYASDDSACSVILEYVLHANVSECAPMAQKIFEQAPSENYRFRMAISVLGKIGSASQKKKLKKALLDRTYIEKNTLIAELIGALGLGAFTLSEIVSIIEQTGPEDRFGGGSMAREMKNLVEEESDLARAEMVLQAILQSLPPLPKGRDFQPFTDQGPTKKAWLYEVLPDCFARVVELLPSDSDIVECCVTAAQQIERIRHTDFVSNDEFMKLQRLVSRVPALRWNLAEQIAASDSAHKISRLEHGSIVMLTKDDFDEIVQRANASDKSAEYRASWFEVGQRVAVRNFKGHQKRTALERFYEGVDSAARRSTTRIWLEARVKGAAEVRAYRRDERNNRRLRKAEHERNVALLVVDLAAIAAGEPGKLLQAFRYVISQLRGHYFDKIDFAEVADKFTQATADALHTGLVAYFDELEIPDPASSSGGSVPWSVLLATAAAHAQADKGAWGAQPPIAKLARLDVWYPNGPSDMFKAIAVGYDNEIAIALGDWVMAEARTLGAGMGVHSAITFAMRQAIGVKLPLLLKLKSLRCPKGVPHPTHRKGLFDDMAEVGVLGLEQQGAIAAKITMADVKIGELLPDMGWYRRWLLAQPDAAWDWFESNLSDAPSERKLQLHQLAKEIGSLKLSQAFRGDARVRILVSLRKVLKPYVEPMVSVSLFDEGSVTELVARIPVLVREELGASANNALAAFAREEKDAGLRQWLLSQQFEHASNDAQLVSVNRPGQLRDLVHGYEADPESEEQLFNQVLARLEEIRLGVEEGPFSDRCLFNEDTPEKSLQLWLAARLAEKTATRRFTVQREEELDDDKQSDIQLGTGKGHTVCIEIKPLNKKRYSAAELVSTLSDQLVGQYLKGHNSAHGILVLFRLVKRSWTVNGKNKQPYEVLNKYLEEHAENIMTKHNKKLRVAPIKALLVFDIRCYVD